MLNFEDLKGIEVNCNTENIPAPFSYSYKIQIELQESDKQLSVTYKLVYTDRDELEEEDIIEEGFSLDDDFEWRGQLTKVWSAELKEIFRKTTWSEKNVPAKNITSSLIIALTKKDGSIINKIPANPESWEYFLQEMIQAIYEDSNKELPLEVKYKEIDDDKQETLILIQPYFSSRTVDVQIENSKKEMEKKTIPWGDLKTILKSVYFPDYDYQYALEKVPNKAGKYIDNGEGVWYEFGVGVKNPNKNVNSLEKLERSLKDLVVE
ncbi:MAG: hypothetical protein M3512_09060 [Bacteroidota bacterium]|nr:hypothetical protein [Bacteroidota bacterium]